MSLNKIKEPLLLKPVGKNYIWGGQRLKELYHKDIDISPLAETWECSTHRDGESVVANGKYRGRTLRDVLFENPEYVGTNTDFDGNIPILTKFIDAKNDLSVQVHPNDEYAKKYENQYGKTEMWYVIEADEGACLVYGFKHKTDRESVERYLRENTITSHLNLVPVKAGDMFFIEPGTVHAIGSGLLIAEIQQSSNVTYRLYDYERKDENGKKRELHIKKALDVIDYGKDCTKIRQSMRILKYRPNIARETMCKCGYFRVDRILFNKSININVDEFSFRVYMFISGYATFSYGDNRSLCVKAGDTVFVPAGMDDFKADGTGEILVISC